MIWLPGWFVGAACFPDFSFRRPRPGSGRSGSGLCEECGPASSFLLSFFRSANSSDASLLCDLSPTAAAVLPLHPSHQNSTPSLAEEWAGHAGKIKNPALGHSSPDPRVVRGSVYIISARLAVVQNPRRKYEPRFEKMRATQERLRALPDSFVRGFRAGLMFKSDSPCKSTPPQWI